MSAELIWMCVNPKVTWNNPNEIPTTSVGSSKQNPFIDSKLSEQRLAIRLQSSVNYPTCNLSVRGLKVESVNTWLFCEVIGNSNTKQKLMSFYILKST